MSVIIFSNLIKLSKYSDEYYYHYSLGFNINKILPILEFLLITETHIILTEDSVPLFGFSIPLFLFGSKFPVFVWSCDSLVFLFAFSNFLSHSSGISSGMKEALGIGDRQVRTRVHHFPIFKGNRQNKYRRNFLTACLQLLE